MTVQNGTFTRTQDFSGQRDTARPMFYEEAVQTGVNDGHPTFRMVERVRIIMPGNGLNIPVFNITDEHRERWPAEYEAFRKKIEPDLNGTPLEQWSILNPARVLELKARNIRTVEDVAGLPDNTLQGLGMGAMRLRELARSYLDEEHEQALVSKVTAENEALREEMGNMERRVSELTIMVETMHSQQMDKGNAQGAVATSVPYMQDLNQRSVPMASQITVPQSSLSDLDSLPTPRRRKASNKDVA